MLKIYLTIISLLVLSACSEDFPASQIYHVDINKSICDRYTLDKENIKVSFDKAIQIKDCPDIIGFEKQEAASVMNWARRMKEKIKECL